MTMKPALFVCLLVSTIAPAQTTPTEVPLERCDRLFLAPVEVDGRKLKFLLDTGATTILDSSRFSGTERDVQITTWTGSKAAAGRTVKVGLLRFAGREIRKRSFPAVDLSPMSSACGQRVDGLLGADILEQVGASIDLERRVASLAVEPHKLYAEAVARFRTCIEGFNLGREKHFRHHLAEDIVWITPFGQVRGRDEVLGFLKRQFFDRGARITLMPLQPEDFRVAGDAYWLNYEYEMRIPGAANGQPIAYKARGSVFARRENGDWLATTVHNSIVDQRLARK